MKNKINNQQGGFLQIIILVIIALIVMKYLGITVSGVLNWLANLLRSVF
jgi:hypothetical protein